MDVMPNDDGSWSGVARAMPDRPVVEGSQMLGQAIVAALRSFGSTGSNRRILFASFRVRPTRETPRPLQGRGVGPAVPPRLPR